MERSITVKVPASSANCGAGFDVLGAACTLYTELTLTLSTEPGLTFDFAGEGAENIPKDAHNIIWRSIEYVLKKAGEEKTYVGGQIVMKNAVPLSRGLGSSAAAIVSGMKAANVIVGNRFSRSELLNFATDMEGHPDNVAPAIFGGFTINVVERGTVQCFSFLPKLHLQIVVAVPDFGLPTRDARNILPKTIPMHDAIYNISRASMLVAGLLKGNERFLRCAFDDALHQPYRRKLIPGMTDVIKAAKTNGALGAVLSGAGPSIAAYVAERSRAAGAVGAAMADAFAAHGVKARTMILDIDTRGAHIAK